MAGASYRKAPLLLLLLLCVAKTAAPGAAVLLEIRSSLKLWSSPSLALPQRPRYLQQVGGPLQAAFIARGPLQQIQRPRSPPALAAAATSQAASCVGMGCRILGVGSAVPEARITNDDLAQVVDTNDEVR